MLPECGYKRVSGLFTSEQCQAIQQHLASSRDQHGLRDVLYQYPQLSGLLTPLMRLIADMPIRRSVLFQKPNSKNWRVPWHQDVLIQVEEQHEQDGFSAWSQKNNFWYVQPPVNIMQSVISLRIHLTDCGMQDGPLRVIPGSHLNGYIPFAGLDDFSDVDAEHILCKQGDVLMMSPLLLHSSLPVESQSTRAVLHLECSDVILPQPLQWAHCIRLHED